MGDCPQTIVRETSADLVNVRVRLHHDLVVCELRAGRFEHRSVRVRLHAPSDLIAFVLGHWAIDRAPVGRDSQPIGWSHERCLQRWVPLTA